MRDTDPLLVLLDTSYNRTSWHGVNLRGSLRAVSLDAAAWRPAPDAHNVWELMVHAAYWKYAAWRRLTGARRGSFPLDGSNFFARPVDGHRACVAGRPPPARHDASRSPRGGGRHEGAYARRAPAGQQGDAASAHHRRRGPRRVSRRPDPAAQEALLAAPRRSLTCHARLPLAACGGSVPPPGLRRWRSCSARRSLAISGWRCCRRFRATTWPSSQRRSWLEACSCLASASAPSRPSARGASACSASRPCWPRGSFAALRSGNANVDAVEAFHFVEYGVLTLLFFPFGQPGARWEAYVEATLATTAVGVADEWFQWFVPGRAGEWHDVLFDLLATACGLLLCLALDVRGRLPSGRGSLDPPQRRGRRLGMRAAVVILLLGAFIATIHLGAEIRDPGIGTFRSRFIGRSPARTRRRAHAPLGRRAAARAWDATAARINTKPKRCGTCAAATSAWTRIARAIRSSSTSPGTRI